LANANEDTVSGIRNDWDEISRDDLEAVAINAELEVSIDGSVHKADSVFSAADKGHLELLASSQAFWIGGVGGYKSCLAVIRIGSVYLKEE
jgi:hypothetical protein